MEDHERENMIEDLYLTYVNDRGINGVLLKAVTKEKSRKDAVVAIAVYIVSKPFILTYAHSDTKLVTYGMAEEIASRVVDYFQDYWNFDDDEKPARKLSIADVLCLADHILHHTGEASRSHLQSMSKQTSTNIAHQDVVYYLKKHMEDIKEITGLKRDLMEDELKSIAEKIVTHCKNYNNLILMGDKTKSCAVGLLVTDEHYDNETVEPNMNDYDASECQKETCAPCSDKIYEFRELIYGRNIDHMCQDEMIESIAMLENQVKHLNRIKTQSKAIDAKKEELRLAIERLVVRLDKGL